jgi:hypothetical protein
MIQESAVMKSTDRPDKAEVGEHPESRTKSALPRLVLIAHPHKNFSRTLRRDQFHRQQSVIGAAAVSARSRSQAGRETTPLQLNVTHGEVAVAPKYTAWALTAPNQKIPISVSKFR